MTIVSPVNWCVHGGMWVLEPGYNGVVVRVWWWSDAGGIQGRRLRVVWSYSIVESGSGRCVDDKTFDAKIAGFMHGCADASMVKNYTMWFCIN